MSAPVRPSTEVRILKDGADAFPARLELIDAAQSEVLFENFIFAGDETGKRSADVLSAATRRGIDVRVLYDPIGTMMSGGSITDILIQKSVTTLAFSNPSFFDPSTWGRMYHRDHRKALTVDGEASIVGGLCISNNWAPPSLGVKDGELTRVGSSNLDPLSMDRNYELNLLVADTVTGSRMQEMFECDLSTATQIELASWRKRPGWQRLAEATGALFGSIL